MATPSLTERRAAASTDLARTDEVRRDNYATVERMEQQFLRALPRGAIAPAQFLRTCLTELRRRPALLDADRASLLGALMYAAELGLSTHHQLGFFYLTGPFKGRRSVEVVPIIGYRGEIELATRDPRVLAVKAEVVREGDEFDFAYGDDEHLHHRPNLTSSEDAPVIAAWSQAMMETPGGRIVRVSKVIGLAEIERTRKRAKSKDDGPWVTDYGAMARKTAVHRLLRGGEVPLRVEVASALSMDEAPMHFDVQAEEIVSAADELEPLTDSESDREGAQSASTASEEPTGVVKRPRRSDASSTEPSSGGELPLDEPPADDPPPPS